MSEDSASSTDQVTPTFVIKSPDNVHLKTALAKAQIEIFNPGKNRAVDGGKGFQYEYAELNVVTDILREPLAKNGLSFSQSPERFEGEWNVLTVLQHSSGEEKSFLYPMFPADAGNRKREQVFAGAFTYAKRQALKGIFGIADDTEDKDGNDDDPKAKITDNKTGDVIKDAAPKTNVKPANVTPPQTEKRSPVPPTPKNTVARPTTDDDDLDRALANNPQAFDFPDEQFPDEPPVTLLDQLVKSAETKNIANEEMRGIIRKVTGESKFAKDLSSDQLTKVLHFINTIYVPKIK